MVDNKSALRRHEEFVVDFFSASGRHPNPKEARHHFERAFIQPENNFYPLRDLIRPVENQRRVIVIDGHPRSGKTWIALAAIVHLLKEQRKGRNHWRAWSSGVDSLKVFFGDRISLKVGFERVCKQIADNKSCDIFFLDDFLGTAEPRNFFRALQDGTDLSRYLRWNNDNPWIEALPRTATLVLTGRSLFFTLADILFDGETRCERPGDCAGIWCAGYRTGVFRTYDKSRPLQAFTRGDLERILEGNRKYHPFKSEQVDDDFRDAHDGVASQIVYHPGIPA